MTNFTSDIDGAAAGYSPDRVDALVWAFSELLVEPMESAGKFELYRRQAEAAEQRNKPQPNPTVYAPARWSGSRRRRRRADPSGGIVLRAPPIPPQCPEWLRKSAAFAPRYRKFESISLQRRV